MPSREQLAAFVPSGKTAIPSTSRSCPVSVPASAGAALSELFGAALPWLDLWAESKALISVDKGGVGAELVSDPPDKGSFAVEGILSASGELNVPNSGRTATEAFDSTGLAAKPLDFLSSFVFRWDCNQLRPLSFWC